jgi:superfamily II helicase
MSVLECDRNGCSNIMCDRFSYEYDSYICNECYNELLYSNLSILDFMNSEKKEVVTIDRSEELEKVFTIIGGGCI